MAEHLPTPVQIGPALHALLGELPPDPLAEVAALCGRRAPRAAVTLRHWSASGWCDRCFLHWLDSRRTPTPQGRRDVRRAYQALGWALSFRDRNILLSLRPSSLVALRLPVELAFAAARELATRPGPRPTLLHDPRDPHARVALVRGALVPPRWPAGVHRRPQGTVLLPPSITSSGPVTWHTPPWPHRLGPCPETRLTAALMHTGAIPRPEPHAAPAQGATR